MSSTDPLQAGTEHHRAGRLVEAEGIYRAALQRNPNDARAAHLLGTLLLQSRRVADAIPMLQRAAAGAGHVAEVHFTLAEALRLIGRPGEAEVAYRKSLSIRPGFAAAHNGLGLALVQQRKMEAAILSWQRAIQLKNDFAEAHANLGAALAEQGRRTEAASMLRRAVELNPNFAPAHNNLANVLHELDETDSAIQHWTRAIELQPRYFEALLNFGKVMQLRGRQAEALDLLQRACAVRPDDADARFLRGLTLLTQGDLANGFADYHFRLAAKDLNLHGRSFAQPALGEVGDGGDIAGKTILLHTEQGLGDTIQFVRYAPLLADHGAKVIVECPPDLLPLIRRVPGIEQVIARPNPLPAFDLHAPVLELPRLFGTTLNTVPANIPYITPDPDRSAAWGDLLAADRQDSDAPDRRIGLVWSGNPKHTNDAHRSIPLRLLEPLADLPGCTFYSLQKGAAAQQVSDSTIKLKLIDYTARLTDFGETAAMISQLDRIVTVDTSVAHLAGAMGKPVWLLVPFVPDWRWMLDRIDSPWYPTMRLFRQTAAGDWQSVIDRVVAELSADGRE